MAQSIFSIFFRPRQRRYVYRQRRRRTALIVGLAASVLMMSSLVMVTYSFKPKSAEKKSNTVAQKPRHTIEPEALQQQHWSNGLEILTTVEQLDHQLAQVDQHVARMVPPQSAKSPKTLPSTHPSGAAKTVQPGGFVTASVVEENPSVLTALHDPAAKPGPAPSMDVKIIENPKAKSILGHQPHADETDSESIAQTIDHLETLLAKQRHLEAQAKSIHVKQLYSPLYQPSLDRVIQKADALGLLSRTPAKKPSDTDS